MAKHYTNPRFEPAKHGFQFNNDFKNFVTAVPFIGLPLPPGLQFTTSGRCGGMSQAAADHFRYQRAIPTVSTLPVDGDVLGDYILKRQYDSFMTVGPDILKVAVLVGEASAWQAQSLPPDGGFFKELKKKIDADKPWPLAYVPVGYNLTNLGTGHQVLAIGYSDDGEIYVYDPNYKNEELTLRFQDHLWKAYRPGHTDAARTIVAWFPDLEYVAQDPGGIFDQGGTKDYTGHDLRTWQPPSKQDLQKYVLKGANLTGNNALSSCDMQGVNASGALFDHCRLVQCDMRTMNLQRANLTAADLTGTTFDGSDMTDATLLQSFLNNTQLKKVMLVNANFNNAKLGTVSFSGSTLKGARFKAAGLDGVKFSNGGAHTGMRFDNAALKNTTFLGVNLTGTTFANAAIAGGSFKDAELDLCLFTHSALANVHLENVDLSAASFANAALNGVEFVDVRNWSTSTWAGASLKNCKFNQPGLLAHIQKSGGHF